jgi:hypothetical protein
MIRTVTPMEWACKCCGGIWHEIDVNGHTGWTVTHRADCLAVLKLLPPSDLTDRERKLLADACA